MNWLNNQISQYQLYLLQPNSILWLCLATSRLASTIINIIFINVSKKAAAFAKLLFQDRVAKITASIKT
ncbi:hypothetical protein CI593_20320 [Fischerella thermalis CCMEE 5194]|nr:hypothetical protein CI593_20320 [Fischerella thermalis CCMEE 5194]